MFPFCRQPRTLDSISKSYRWFIFLTGVFEVSLWSGTVFGWASVVHVLKTHGVYGHLCHNESVSVRINVTDREEDEAGPKTVQKIFKNCNEQDRQLALIGTVAMALYTFPGLAVGYALHYWGLAFTRLFASSVISGGFVLLSLTTKENPGFLWGASMMLSIGGNTLRVTCLEFANLFPDHRYTAMSVISGSYTVSAALFLIVQLAVEGGFAFVSVCHLVVGTSSLSLILTLFMPIKHIPLRFPDPRKSLESSAEVQEFFSSDDSLGLPLKMSLLSVSSGLHFWWLFVSLFAVHAFAIVFNSWINSITTSEEEVANYSRYYGYANIVCVFVVPLPGLLVDALYLRLGKGKVGVDTRVARLQAMILPLLMVSVICMVQLSCMYSSSSWAVYLSLTCLVINRSSCWGVGSLFIRARFPVDHFNRIIGIYGSSLALLSLLQCLHLLWLQKHFLIALAFLIGVVLTTFVHPLFLFKKRHLRRVVNELHAERSRKDYLEIE